MSVCPTCVIRIFFDDNYWAVRVFRKAPDSVCGGTHLKHGAVIVVENKGQTSVPTLQAKIILGSEQITLISVKKPKGGRRHEHF